MSCVRADKTLTVGKIDVRQVGPYNYDAITISQQPLQRRFVHAQSVPGKVGRRIENVVQVAKAEGLPTP
jgi:hypothetical protein